MNAEYRMDIYKIFNDIQTRTETKENLELFMSIFEKKSVKHFNESVEKVFLIIFQNFDKNHIALKNIKEFLKLFIENIIKLPKLKENTKSFLKHFCQLFTCNAKKQKYKSICVYFISTIKF